MRIVYITAGSGRMECDACLRDADYARGLMQKGHEVLFVPTYTPLITEDARSMAGGPLFYGGINVYLRRCLPFLAKWPRFLTAWLDSSFLLKLAARLGDMTNAADLAGLTISVLRGEEGEQRAELERMMDWLAKEMQPDVIVLPNSLFVGMARPLKRRFGCSVLCLLSGEDGFIEMFPEPWRSRTRKVLVEQASAADGFGVSTEYYRDFMMDYLKAPSPKFQLLPMGIDIRLYPDSPARPPRDPWTIGFRSPVSPTTGLDVLAEAFLQLKQTEEGQLCRLKVAGYVGASDQSYLRGIRERIEAAGYGGDLQYVGELAPEQRPGFLSGLHALCVPPSYPEPVGMFAVEAMAAGVPVVAPPSGCLPEWLSRTGGGIVAKSNAAEALAESLLELRTNPDHASEMAHQGQMVVRRDEGLNAWLDAAEKWFQGFSDKG